MTFVGGGKRFWHFRCFDIDLEPEILVQDQ